MASAAVKAVEPEPENEPVGIDNMTAAETAMAERKAGQSITSLGNENLPKANLLGALGWVLARRTDPKVTFEQYMNSHTLVQIGEELGFNDDDTEDEDEEGKDDAAST
jgi:hypothetical protein